ncbi:MAG: hypothetical protein OXG88_00295 [Gammaproteobacteria bacterium]|nr:hypothetical protein [Gammaproteobacteria bacterium]
MQTTSPGERAFHGKGWIVHDAPEAWQDVLQPAAVFTLRVVSLHASSKW